MADVSDLGHAASEQGPNDREVEQRIRNRVIEYLDLAASFEAQRQLEVDAPIEHVPYEVINAWEDNFPKHPLADTEILAVFSPEEVEAIRKFDAAWEVAAEAISDDYPSLESVQALPEWSQLRDAAESARQVFARRGRLPEEREVP